MRSTTTLLAALASLLALSDGLALKRREDGPPRVVSLSTERRSGSSPLERDRLRRRGAVTAKLDNEETLYFVNATVGTPPQSLRLHLDTGSSDLWVNTPASSLCAEGSNPCSFAGTYRANSSSTYQYIGSYFNISYVDGTGASGDYVSDTFTIGSTTLPRLQFGIGYSSSAAQGILGIGYQVNEVQVGRANKASYLNLPAQMASSGMIQANAYSLWLNDLDANTGNILFGGVDTEQYVGALQTLPVQENGGTFAEFLITLTAVHLGSTAIATNQALAVLLDSGSSLSYLPNNMVQQIYNAVGATYDDTQQAAYVPCSLRNQKTNLTFTFSSPSIAVEMNELVLTVTDANGKQPTFSNGQPACLFGIAPSSGGTNVLGDTFLRSAYVVYNLDNNEISIAQTNFNSTKTSVREISAGASGVPDATSVANPIAATAGLSGGSVSSGGSSAGLPASAPRPGAAVVVALLTAAVTTGAGVLVSLS